MIGTHIALIGRRGRLTGWPLWVLMVIKLTAILFFMFITIQHLRQLSADEKIRLSGDTCVAFDLDDESIFSGKSLYKHHWKPRTLHFFYDGVDHAVEDCSNVPPEVEPGELRGKL